MGGQFYGKQAIQNQLHDYLRFEVHGEGLFSSLWVRFSVNGSDEAVYGDALKLQPLTREHAIFGTRKSDETLLDIGHFLLYNPEIEIPVHFNATKNGTYTITATDLNLPSGPDLYFSDLQTGESKLIDNRFEYSFTNSRAQRVRPDETDILSCNASPQKTSTAGEDRFLITYAPPNSPGDDLPQQVTLNQNYPNPFNPATIISFNLPEQTDIRLEVFDMAGRQVATLADGTMQAGVHTVNFDASHLSSGIYMYTLLADGISITKKLTLIK
ncbi:MAG: T9SS type A sorting domain-containing protein [Balneolaceae bacterium]|nr:T9SS type A sorting domain-containing protein [Balneolaceae bacterium]